MAGSSSKSLVPAAGRLFWIIVGPLVLTGILYRSVCSGERLPGLVELSYFVVLCGMIAGRWLEFRGGSPLKADGQPAVPADMRRYVRQLAVVGPAAWLVAQLLRNLMLSR